MRRKLRVVKYGPPFSLSRFFRIFGETDSKIELQLPKQLVPQLEVGTCVFPAELLRAVEPRDACDPTASFAAFGAAPSFVLNVFFALYFLASIYVYISLSRQIRARTSERVRCRRGETRRFGLPEAILAAAVDPVSFAQPLARRFRNPPIQFSARNLLANLLLTVLRGARSSSTFLQFRGFDVSSLGGFFRIRFYPDSEHWRRSCCFRPIH